MPSKIKPIPLRLPDDLKGQVLDHAKLHGLSQQGALLDLIRIGLGAPASAPAPLKSAGKKLRTPTKDPKTVLKQAEAAAAHLAPRPKLDTSMVQNGPTPQEYGGRLDKSYAGGAAKKRRWR